MDKKTILITGAGSGIGMALAKKYHNMGWFVGMLDISEKPLADLANKFGQDNCFYKVTDVTDEKAVNESISAFSQKTGGVLHVLAANAGIIVQKPFEQGTQSAYRKLVDINAFGAVNTIYGALPLLKNTKSARVVITSSSSAMYGIPDFAVYSATKGFLRNLTEALNIELEKHDIWVSDVMPLFVQTNMMNSIETKYKAELTPEVVANTIAQAATNKKIHNLIGKGMTKTYLAYKFLPIKTFKRVLTKYLGYK